MNAFSVKKIWAVWLVAVLLTGCKGSFTDDEMKIVREGDGVMRLWTVEKPQEEVFLRQKARPLQVTDGMSETYQLLKKRMLATVTDTANPGVGIAAPQVGVSCRLIAVQRFDKEGEPFEFYLNPKIVRYSDEKVCGPEGCLSIPNIVDSVWRSNEIVISYKEDPWVERRDEVSVTGIHRSIKIKQDLTSKEETIRGFTAVIFQHEIDHLDGILFTDRVQDKK